MDSIMDGVGNAIVHTGTMHGHTTMDGMMDIMQDYMQDTIITIMIPITHSITDAVMLLESVAVTIIAGQDQGCMIIPTILAIALEKEI